MNFVFDGNFRPTIEFQPIDLSIQSPNVPSRGPIGFPAAIPISSRVSRGGQIYHSWWETLVFKEIRFWRFIEDNFVYTTVTVFNTT